MVSISTVSNTTQTVSTANSTAAASTTTAQTTTVATPTITTTNSSTAKVSAAALSVAKAAAASTVTLSVADVLKSGYTPVPNTVIKDTAANIQTNLKAIAAITPAANITGITLSDTAKGTISVARADLSGDPSDSKNTDPEVLLLKKITTAFNLTVTGLTASDALTLKSTSTSATLTMSVSDTAANLSTNLDALQAKVKAKSITALSIAADPAQTSKPMLSISAKQLTADADALAALRGDFDLTITGVLAADALKTAGAADAVLKKSGSATTLSKITIADTSANITKSIATLETAATAGRLSSITVTDNAALNLTEAQALADADVLKVQFTTQTKLNITNMAAKDFSDTKFIDITPSNFNSAMLQSSTSDGNLMWGYARTAQGVDFALTTNKNGEVSIIKPDGCTSSVINGLSPDGKSLIGHYSGVVNENTFYNRMFALSFDGKFTDLTPSNANYMDIYGASTDKSVIWGNYQIPNVGTRLFIKVNSNFNLDLNKNLNLNSETVTDTAANITANLDNIQAAVKAKTVTAITVSDKNPITVSGTTGVTNHAEALAAITNAYTLKVDKLTATDAIALKSPSKNATLSLAVTDTAANIASNLDKLQALVKAKTLSSITVSDSASPITITSAQLKSDPDVLKLLTNAGGIAITGVLAADAAKTAATPGVKTIAIADSAANIIKSATALKTLAASNKITSIFINDKTAPTVKIADVLAVNDIGVQDTHGVDGVKYNIADTASNIIAHARFDIGDVIKNAKLISITDTKTPVLTLADAQTLTSITKLDPKTKYSIADGGATIAAQAAISGEKVLSGAQAVTINKNYTIAQAKSVLALKNLDKNNTYAITDTVANILAESKISGSKVFAGATAVNVSDSQGNVFANADDLEKLFKSSLLTDINITNSQERGGFDISQLWPDSEVFGKILQIGNFKAQTFKSTSNGITNFGIYTASSTITASLYQPKFKINTGLTNVSAGDYSGFYNLNNEPGHLQIEFDINNSNINENDGINLLNQFLSSTTPQQFNAAINTLNSHGITPIIKFVLDQIIDPYGNGTKLNFAHINSINYVAPSATDTSINLTLKPTTWIGVNMMQSFIQLPKSGITNSWGSLGSSNSYNIKGNEIGLPLFSLNASTSMGPSVMKYLAAISSAKSPQEFDAAYKDAMTAGPNNLPPFNVGLSFDMNDGGFGLNYAGLSQDGTKIIFKGNSS